jgi:hypothetical protein
LNHLFTEVILEILSTEFKDESSLIFEQSLLLRYINAKTRSANRGSKARGSFASLYAIYVLLEDYVKNNYHQRNDYKFYEGAKFSELFKRQRGLPFGSKLQNHALNNRVNSEFQKFFPLTDITLILRQDERYWINENLLKINGKNIALSVIQIIERYIQTKQESFQIFLETCQKLMDLEQTNPKEAVDFIVSQLNPNIDARIFEIVSYAILKSFYSDQKIYWGWQIDQLKSETLTLYKTGRTNANDGGIDFVMRPLGRFFQVTETLDFKKYFLDIEKVQYYPMTFVIKSEESIEALHKRILENAQQLYGIESIVQKYINSIEEIINIPILIQRLEYTLQQKQLVNVLNDIVEQSKLEFNHL